MPATAFSWLPILNAITVCLSMASALISAYIRIRYFGKDR